MIRVLGPAGFWRRAAAFGLDGLWLFCVAGTVSWLVFGIALPYGVGGGWRVTGAALVHELLPALVLVAGWARYGTTPGKLLLDLRVVDARSGARPGAVQAVLRYVGYFVSALPLGLGFLWIVFDRHNEALHDKLARTRVVVVEEAILPAPGRGAT